MKPERPAPNTLTILICTHNRVDLLSRVIASLDGATQPAGWRIRLFVVANACSDGTHAFLTARGANPDGGLPLTWVAEPTPGKSHALNRALPLLEDELVAFVDDDHRVDASYLEAITGAASSWPEADLFCGRIVPDWDGTEPAWVHDEGPYRIYPLPVPRYDQGQDDFAIDVDGPIPGGGNLVARLAVIARTGPFAIELGPTGHDLGGSEDADWILRALRNGTRLHYVPAILQYHYVDSERLTLSYVARKGFQRSQSVTRVRAEFERVPRYMWRKAAGYAAGLALSWRLQARRFYLVRLSSALGEISGIRDQHRRRRKRAALPMLGAEYLSASLLAIAATALALAAMLGRDWLGEAAFASGLVGAFTAALLVVKSVRDFSRTGPGLRDEIVNRYRNYIVFALARLAFASLCVAAFWAFPGAALWISAAEAMGREPPLWSTAAGGALTLALATVYAGCRALSLNPGLVIASWQYRTVRIHRLWRALSRRGLDLIARIVLFSGIALVSALAVLRYHQDSAADAGTLLLAACGYIALLLYAIWEPDGAHARTTASSGRRNVVMIGSDTLRADRIGAQRDGVSITPHIDALAAQGALFSACYVPCARTAPSLISLFTGTWPHHHGVRDNYVTEAETRLKDKTLPNVLRALGYRTAAVSDWCGADLGKFDFGFDITDLPADQWNLKYLVRQGPKDIRLFLSLFLHNRLGRQLLPEIHYLGGVPQTGMLGRRARRTLTRLANTSEPFLLNIFYSTTHPPFASEHPYYTRFSDPAYSGASKFAMARLTEPFEIIRRQGEPREEFDLDQILDLYDGCVAQFDDEVGRLMRQIEASGLAENTVIVLYSDHGMEFFEHGTWGQGNSALGDFSARVPLVVVDAKQARGQRIDQVVRSVDIMPTLLELLDAPSVGCDGVSLVPTIADPTTDLHLKAFNETGIWIAPVPGLPEGHLSYPNLLELLDIPDPDSGSLAIRAHYQQEVVVAKDRMVRDGPWKLVYQPLESGRKLSLYNVAADPGCTSDVAAKYPEEVVRLWGELHAWMANDPALREDRRLELDPAEAG
ncbi:sulfatase [Thauera sp. 28]|uniref:sulfatase-like hydrolase/transferase n=1 Tax=Thauera sp. 28 TaxID=303682 RepID=UPI0002D00A72|nr:sulfatase-like hydrolase/transferase [Thauera sp. 28]ENO93371.1 sulfatase [Thauera sp. 28]